MKALSRAINSLISKHKDYVTATGVVEAKLTSHIEFEFGVENLPGDGFCILHVEHSIVAPLDACVKIIQDNGHLTAEDHARVSI